MLTEQQYLSLAGRELGRLTDALDELSESLETTFEVELASDIITIEFDDDAKFVINSHRAARQIWMAAGSSAWHFDYDASADRWWAQKQQAELWASVTEQIATKLGRTVVLNQ